MAPSRSPPSPPLPPLLPALLLQQLLLLLAARPARAQFESLCFPRDQFRFSVVDPASGQTVRWDLSTLCRSSGTYSYEGFGTEGQTFYFNVGGNTSVACSDYQSALPMYESWGVAVQLLQPGRGVNPRDDCLREDGVSECVDWTYGGPLCCSPRRCEVVALEAAVFSPLNMKNLTGGGVLLKHAGYPGSDNDFLKCPEQAPGLPRLRSLELNMACDPAGDSSSLVVTGYNEGDDGEDGQYCRFQVFVKTLAACGVPDPVVVPTPAPQSASDAINALLASGALVNAGGQFGYCALGCVLTLAAQWLFANALVLRAWLRGDGRGSGNGLSFRATRYSGESAAAAATPLAAGGGYGAVKSNAFAGL